MMKAPSPRLGALRLVIATPAQDEQRPTERPDGSPLDFQTHNKKRYQDGTKARSQSLRRCTPNAAPACENPIGFRPVTVCNSVTIRNTHSK